METKGLNDIEREHCYETAATFCIGRGFLDSGELERQSAINDVNHILCRADFCDADLQCSAL